MKVEFGPGLYINVKEIKVIKADEPLVLIGNDVLSNDMGKWKFAHIGVHPRKEIGHIVFVGKQDTYTVQLHSWPIAASTLLAKLPANKALPKTHSDAIPPGG